MVTSVPSGMNDKISYLPSLYSCTVEEGNIIYDQYKKDNGIVIDYKPVKKTKYNKIPSSIL